MVKTKAWAYEKKAKNLAQVEIGTFSHIQQKTQTTSLTRQETLLVACNSEILSISGTSRHFLLHPFVPYS